MFTFDYYDIFPKKYLQDEINFIKVSKFTIFTVYFVQTLF